MATERLTLSPVPHARMLGIGAGLGGAMVALGLVFEGARPWASMLLVGTYAVTTAAAALLLVALGYVSGAGWSVAVRRVPEAIAVTLPYGALLLAPAAFGMHALYHWSHPAVLLDDPILAGKAVWLNVPFFLGRAVVYLGIWYFFARTIRTHSLAQDRDGLLAHTKANVRWSTIYLIVYALTTSAAAFDWIMSLDAHWFSTMFSVYIFSGSIVAALALTLVVLIVLRRAGVMPEVSDSHLHDLGRLLFGFSCFWAYIWFSQYMLIWYANMSEETGWYAERTTHGWELLFWVVPVLLFAVPFFGLMRRGAKRSESVLLHVSIVVLVGRWLDLFVTIYPSVLGQGPTLGLSEVGGLVLAVCAMTLAIASVLRRAPLVPMKDPYLEESLHHHVGQTM